MRVTLHTGQMLPARKVIRWIQFGNNNNLAARGRKTISVLQQLKMAQQQDAGFCTLHCTALQYISLHWIIALLVKEQHYSIPDTNWQISSSCWCVLQCSPRGVKEGMSSHARGVLCWPNAQFNTSSITFRCTVPFWVLSGHNIFPAIFNCKDTPAHNFYSKLHLMCWGIINRPGVAEAVLKTAILFLHFFTFCP